MPVVVVGWPDSVQEDVRDCASRADRVEDKELQRFLVILGDYYFIDHDYDSPDTKASREVQVRTAAVVQFLLLELLFHFAALKQDSPVLQFFA